MYESSPVPLQRTLKKREASAPFTCRGDCRIARRTKAKNLCLALSLPQALTRQLPRQEEPWIVRHGCGVLRLPQLGRGVRDAMRFAEFSRWENILPDEVLPHFMRHTFRSIPTQKPPPRKKTTLLGGLSRGGDNCESAAPQERHTECLHLLRRGGASGFICAALAAVCILVDSMLAAPRKKITTRLGGCFLVETTGTITPISPHFTHCLRLSKNRTTMRFFALFVSARATAKIQIFRKFVYDSCTVLWAGTPLPIGFFNTTPICSRRTRCTARGAPSSARPERRRRSPSSSSVPWKARPCFPPCPCPM